MAYYINPPEGTREWLFNNANRISEQEAERFRGWPDQTLLVFIEDMDVLRVVYDTYERIASLAEDGRHRTWYSCSRVIVEAVLKDHPWKEH